MTSGNGNGNGNGAKRRPTDRICVALDVPTLDEAVELASSLRGEVGWFKVGLELFGAHGPEAVRAIREHGPVFLDLKMHDIPTTVARAAKALGVAEVGLLTVHASGGLAMMSAAVEGLVAGSGGAGRVLAVTVLTSMSDDELAVINTPPSNRQVPDLARLAVEAGVPGLVCAPDQISTVRAATGPDTFVVTPGIRPAGGDEHDHARTTTPAQALREGADLLVVGRPITRSADPVAAARAIVQEAADALVEVTETPA